MALGFVPEIEEALAERPLESPLAAATRVAETVAKSSAAAVDREARFPCEALEGLRSAGLLAALVPRELGGLGASLFEIVQMTEALARGCAATAMIFAVHQ